MKKTNNPLKRYLLLTVSGSTAFNIVTAAVVDPPLDPILTLVTILAATFLTALALLGH